MTVKLFINGKKVGRDFERGMVRQAARVRENIRKVVLQTCRQIEKEGRKDIRSAGRFGTRWTEGFTAIPTLTKGNTVILVTEQVPYWSVFQKGATIRGRPLLWIPLSFAIDAKGIRAKNYPGPLFRVNRKTGGAPLLLTTGGKPKYFGKPFVRIPKKFHLIEIARAAANAMPALYRQISTGNKKSFKNG